MIFTSSQNGGQFRFHSKNQFNRKKFAMAPYHILIVMISSIIPEILVLLTKSEQSGPKSAHIRPTKPTAQQNFGLFGQTIRWVGLAYVNQIYLTVKEKTEFLLASIDLESMNWEVLIQVRCGWYPL